MITITKLNNPMVVTNVMICFHWVGGSATSYKHLARSLESERILVFGVNLPGRNGRIVKMVFKSFVPLVEAAVAEIENLCVGLSNQNIPLFFFGHSFGGILAFEVVRALEMKQSPFVPNKLVISAVHSPDVLTAKNKNSAEVFHHRENDTELFSYIKKIGGLPKGVDPAFLKVSLPSIRADYEAFETYDSANFGNDKIKCPLAVFYAKEDASVDTHEVANWINQAEIHYETVEFGKGSHFYLTEEPHRNLFYSKLIEVCN